MSSFPMIATYAYDGDGLKKVSEEVSTGLTTLVWDGSDYLQGRLITRTNAAMFESHNFPTQVSANSTTSVTVTMRNTGTSTWTPIDSYRLGSQAPQDSNIWLAQRAALPTGSSIAPGQLATFTFNIKAPATAGVYALQFRMIRDGVEWFGAQTPLVWVTVV